MGGFLYVQKRPADRVEDIGARYRNSVDTLRKRCLPLAETIVADDFVVYLFKKVNVPDPNFVRFHGGDFALSTGTLVYGSAIGTGALTRLYNDFSGSGSFVSNIMGHYCVLLFKQGSLYIFNDYHGLYRVYTNQSKTVISSSFLATLKSCASRTLSTQAFYEYLTHGAVHGSQTLLEEVLLLEKTRIHRISPRNGAIEKSLRVPSLNASDSMDRLVSQVGDELLDYFQALGKNFGDSITSALSGGFDSRLMLALMRRTGIHPQLYVYGGADSPDVVAAKRITEGLGLSIDHVDKSQHQTPDPEGFLGALEAQFRFVDGQGAEGAFDNGADLASRLQRTGKARLHLNGGGGEIYRNYWMLPSRDMSIGSFFQASYSRIDFSIYSSLFEKEAYFATLADKIKAELKIQRDVLTRSEVDLLYVLLRMNFWMAQNNSNNNTLSFSLTPFGEARFNLPSAEIPVKYKQAGVFESNLIRYVDREVAKYPSIYGFNFEAGPGRMRRFKHALSAQTPVWLRPAIRRRRWRRSQGPRPFYMQERYLSRIVKQGDLEISRYVDINRVHERGMLSRLLTVELLLSDRF